MIDNVTKSYGNSYILHTLPISNAGKTGTAQTNWNQKVNALYVGYAPVDHPQIVMMFLVENATEGKLNAVPIFSDALNWYYQNRISKGIAD